MKTHLSLFAIAALAGMSLAQTPPAPSPSAQAPAQTQNQIASGTIIIAELSKSVDAKKIKSGDKIEAKTTVDLLSHGQIVIPRNTKILGHVTNAKPHTKDSPDSMIGIAFDHLSLKDGRELPIQAAVQAIGRPLLSASQSTLEPLNPNPGLNSAPSAQRSSPMEAPATQPVSPNASANYPGSYPSSPASASAPDTGAPAGSPVSPLNPNSQGAIGMKGITVSSTKEASVVSSNNQNVHLEGGTQLILRTE